MASRLRISLSSSILLALAMAAAVSLDHHLNVHHQRTLLLVAAAGAAAALVAVWRQSGSGAGRGLDVNALFGRQLEAAASLKRRASTPPSRDDGSRELRDLPQRAPLPQAATPSHRWHLLPTPHAPAPAPELTPLQRKYLARVSEKLRRAAAQHGLSLTASSSSSSPAASTASPSLSASVPTSLSLHAGSLTPTSSPSSGPRICITTLASSDGSPSAQLRLLVSLHARDAEEACAKGWAARVTHHFGVVRDRHEVEVARAPGDEAELAVVLELVDAGVKYLRSQAADFLCNEILDLVF